MLACAGSAMITPRQREVSRGVDPVQWHPARRMPAQPVLPLVHRPEPGPQQGVAGVDQHLLPGLDVLDDDQADLRQIVIRGVHDAQRDHLVPPCASRSSGRSHSPLPMKSETTTTRQRRRALRY